MYINIKWKYIKKDKNNEIKNYKYIYIYRFYEKYIYSIYNKKRK